MYAFFLDIDGTQNLKDSSNYITLSVNEDGVAHAINRIIAGELNQLVNKEKYMNRLSPFKWFVLQNFPFIEADFDALTISELWSGTLLDCWKFDDLHSR